ncbi:MAG: hypothetical protein R3B68_07025 [Phycisphaerales bacterium]
MFTLPLRRPSNRRALLPAGSPRDRGRRARTPSVVLAALLVCTAPLGTPALADPTHDPDEANRTVLITVHDHEGVRIDEQPAVLIAPDMVVVPSMSVWGATDISLSFGGEPRAIEHVYEARGVNVQAIVFSPPVPVELVPALPESLDPRDLGDYLSSRAQDPQDDSAERPRLLHSARNAAGVRLVTTHAGDYPAGTAFFHSDGRLAGILSESADLSFGLGDRMSLIPGVVLRMMLDYKENPDRQDITALGPVIVDRPAHVAQLSRLWLSGAMTESSLSAFVARWNAIDPDWTAALPEEFFFQLATQAIHWRLEPLLLQVLESHPELDESGTDRLALVRATHQLRFVSTRGGLQQLSRIAEAGSDASPVAATFLSSVLIQMGASGDAMRYLRIAINAYRSDPRPFMLAADAHAALENIPLFTDVARVWQYLDYSPESSFSPSRQLLAWGETEAAAEFARTGVERWPEDMDCREALIRALVALDDLPAARENLQVIRDHDAARADRLLEQLPRLTTP